jgi:hypothetical protein
MRRTPSPSRTGTRWITISSSRSARRHCSARLAPKTMTFLPAAAPVAVAMASLRSPDHAAHRSLPPASRQHSYSWLLPRRSADGRTAPSSPPDPGIERQFEATMPRGSGRHPALPRYPTASPRGQRLTGQRAGSRAGHCPSGRTWPAAGSGRSVPPRSGTRTCRHRPVEGLAGVLVVAVDAGDMKRQQLPHHDFPPRCVRRPRSASTDTLHGRRQSKQPAGPRWHGRGQSARKKPGRSRLKAKRALRRQQAIGSHLLCGNCAGRSTGSSPSVGFAKGWLADLGAGRSSVHRHTTPVGGEAGGCDWPGGPPQQAGFVPGRYGQGEAAGLMPVSSWSAASGGDSFAQMFGRLTRHGA